MNRQEQIEYVKQNINKASIRSIAKQIGVHHTTISYWIKNNFESDQRTKIVDEVSLKKQILENPVPYLYILGLYLTDGHISKMPRTYRLRISTGSKYRDVILRACKALEHLLNDNIVNPIYHKKDQVVNITVYSNALPILFPQHALGKKHDRDVSLLDWQMELVDDCPAALLLGLHDGDGSEYLQTNLDNVTYYNFTNKSKHIINLYQHCCDRLGIELKNQVKSNTADIQVLTCRKKQYRELFESAIQPVKDHLDSQTKRGIMVDLNN